jgi:hypothetical protein
MVAEAINLSAVVKLTLALFEKTPPVTKHQNAFKATLSHLLHGYSIPSARASHFAYTGAIRGGKLSPYGLALALHFDDKRKRAMAKRLGGAQ